MHENAQTQGNRRYILVPEFLRPSLVWEQEPAATVGPLNCNQWTAYSESANNYALSAAVWKHVSVHVGNGPGSYKDGSRCLDHLSIGTGACVYLQRCQRTSRH